MTFIFVPKWISGPHFLTCAFTSTIYVWVDIVLRWNLCTELCTCIVFFFFLFVRVCTFSTGQAPWKQQQRSSAFKWIKTPAQSPGPAGIGQTGCSLDEDLRLIISHVAFVFAALLLQIWVILYSTQRYSVPCMLEVKGMVVFVFQLLSGCFQLCRALLQWSDPSALNVYLQLVCV